MTADAGVTTTQAVVPDELSAPDFPLAALILAPADRQAAFLAWRNSVDIEHLSHQSIEMLPAVAHLLPVWLEGDPEAARLQGIVKMAWSRNQVRLHQAVSLRQSLVEAGIEPVVFTGPLAWSLSPREQGAIRTIPDLTLLIPRGFVAHALAVAQQAGWHLQQGTPDDRTLIWAQSLAFTRGEHTLHLHWRLFPAVAEQAEAFETAMLQCLQTVTWRGHPLPVLSPEVDLLHRLMDRPSWDPVPWQADVLMMSMAQVDWERYHGLLDGFARYIDPIEVNERLVSLERAWGLSVPPTTWVPRCQPVAQTSTPTGLRKRFERWRETLWKP